MPALLLSDRIAASPPNDAMGQRPASRALPEPLIFAAFRRLVWLREAFAVGKAKGVALDSSFVDRCMDYVANEIEPNRKASMAYDLEQGRRLELDWLTGKVRAVDPESAVKKMNFSQSSR